MSEIVSIPVESCLPDAAAMLTGMGVPPDQTDTPLLRSSAERGIETYRALTKPTALYEQILPDEFAEVLIGEGRNLTPNPVADLYRQSRVLFLFAATVGEELSTAITELMDANDYERSVMLDAAASLGVEAAAEYLGDMIEGELRKAGSLKPGDHLMAFSPGYCGWDITGQKKLFDHLKPEQIGIGLNESCLMTPLKSISGVFLAGPAGLFDFATTYQCCDECTTFSCRERFESISAAEE